MANKFWPATSLTEGDGALTAIPTAEVTAGDAAFVVVDGSVYFYRMETTIGADHTPPTVIAPADVGGGASRWLLTPAYPVAPSDGKAYGMMDGGWTEVVPLVLWTPSLLTTALWYDAADGDTITITDSKVSSWADKSGNSRNAGQADAALRPTVVTEVFNQLNALQFLNIDILDVSYLDIARNISELSIFVVNQRTGGHTSGVLFNASTGVDLTTNPRCALVYNTATSIRAIGRSLDEDTSLMVNQADVTGLNLGAAIFNYGLQTLEIGLNGAYTARGDGFYGPENTPDTSSYQVSIGGMHTESNLFAGEIAEIIVVQSILSELNRQKLEGYIAHKWGISSKLDALHPYKDSAPTVE